MKNCFSIFVFLILCFQIIGCAPKMHIAYKTDSGGDYLKNNICDKKMGVLSFNDKRIERDNDKFFEEIPTKVFQNLLVTKFKAHCGDNARPVEYNSSELDKAFIVKHNNTDLDYLIVGSLNSYSSNFKDKYHALRMAGSVLSGLTFPVGLAIFPFVLIGDVDQVTDIQADDIALIDARTRRILWKGGAKKQIIDAIPFIKAGSHTNEEKYNAYSKEVVDSIYQSISVSYDNKFPDQLSVDNSKVVIVNISGN